MKATWRKIPSSSTPEIVSDIAAKSRIKAIPGVMKPFESQLTLALRRTKITFHPWLFWKRRKKN
jgi:hypothetical protein